MSAADEIGKLEDRVEALAGQLEAMTLIVPDLRERLTAAEEAIAKLTSAPTPPSAPPPPPTVPPPPPPIPVPSPAPVGSALARPTITAPSTQQGVDMTRQMAKFPNGWEAYQGRWYVDGVEIGGQAVQSTNGIAIGKTVVYREWWRNGDKVETVDSAPFGPITSIVVVSGASTLR